VSGRPNKPRVSTKVLVKAIVELRAEALVAGELELNDELGAILQYLRIVKPSTVVAELAERYPLVAGFLKPGGAS
jgi:hypothetical protein